MSLQILMALLCHLWCLSIFQVSCMLRLAVHMYTCYGRDQLLRVWKQQACSILCWKKQSTWTLTYSLSSSEAEHSLKHDFWEKENLMLKQGKIEREITSGQVFWEELIYNYNKENSFLYKITLINNTLKSKAILSRI